MTTVNNPQLQALCLDFIKLSVEVLGESEEKTDVDVVDSFLPAVIEKGLGSNRSNILNIAKDIIESAVDCVDLNLIICYLWDAARSKNNRIQAEGLLAIHSYICRFGTDMIVDSKIGKRKMIQELAKMLDKASNSTRNPILEILVLWYREIGPKMWKAIDKKLRVATTLLEKRLKSETFEKDDNSNDVKQESATPRKVVVKRNISTPTTPSVPDRDEVYPSEPVHRTYESFGALPTAFELDFSKFDRSTRKSLATIDYNDVASGTIGKSYENRFPAEEKPSKMQFNPAPFPSSRTSGSVSERCSTFDEQMYSCTSSIPHNPSELRESSGNELSFILTSLQNRTVAGLDTLDEMLSTFTEAHQESLQKNINTVISALSTWLEDLVENYSQEMFSISGKILNPMLTISGSRELLKHLTMNILEDYIKILLTTLISPTIRIMFPNKRYVINKLNSITLAVLQNGDRTSVFCALLKFLKLARPFPSTSDPNRVRSLKFSNLVVKCLAKIQMQIQTCYHDVNVGLVLRVIHEFFVENPASVWELQGANAKPYICVRECLSKFCEALGENIIPLIEEFTSSSGGQPLIHNLVHSWVHRKQPSNTQPTQEVVTDRLLTAGEILERVQQNKTGALEELHRFLLSYPSIKLDTLMTRKSDIFKGYVKRHLENLDSKLGTHVVPPSLPMPPLKPTIEANAHSVTKSGTGGVIPTSSPSPTANILERLRRTIARKQANKELPPSTPSTFTSSVEPAHPANLRPGEISPPRSNAVKSWNMQKIKERFNELKAERRLSEKQAGSSQDIRQRDGLTSLSSRRLLLNQEAQVEPRAGRRLPKQDIESIQERLRRISKGVEGYY